MKKIKIRDDMIRLGQLLKHSGAASSGSEAKHRVQSGHVLVNGDVETKRGRQLHSGDIVEVDGQSFEVVS